MKRIGFIVLAALALLVGYRLYQAMPASGGGPAGPRVGAFGRPVGAAVAERGPISESVTLVGALRAQDTVDVTPRINGRVVQMDVDLGDRVGSGQLLARLEDDELRQQVQQSEASLQVAQAVVEQRELELRNLQAIRDRTQGLADQGLISTEELEAAQTRMDVGQSQVNLARAQLVQSEAGVRELLIRLDQTRILAPISGLVGRRFVDVGTRVNSNTPVVTLINLDTVELVANVSERDLPKLELAANGDVTVDALPGEIFTGEVARISPLLDPQTRTARVEIVIPNENGRLKAEMFARVDLDLVAEREVLRVPRDSLLVRGQQQGLYVIEDDIAHYREVDVGITVADWVEITSGLDGGETVVTLGANLIKDGDRVSVAGAAREEQSP